MKSRFDKPADVVSSDGQEMCRLEGMDDRYLLVHKKGLLGDEQYRIPVSAVLQDESNAGSVKFSLSEEQLKHGREIVKGRPNSELIRGNMSAQELCRQADGTLRTDKGKPGKIAR